MSAEDVRALHSKFGLYGGCDCDLLWRRSLVPYGTVIPGKNTPEFHEGRFAVEIDDVGWTCEEPQWVCRECDTDDGETHEYSDEGEWPCRTIQALDKP